MLYQQLPDALSLPKIVRGTITQYVKSQIQSSGGWHEIVMPVVGFCPRNCDQIPGQLSEGGFLKLELDSLFEQTLALKNHFLNDGQLCGHIPARA
jgi:hypothetical protein